MSVTIFLFLLMFLLADSQTVLLPNPPPSVVNPCPSNISSVDAEHKPHVSGSWKMHKVSRVSAVGENILSISAEPGYVLVNVLATVNLVVQNMNHITMTDTQASYSADVGGAGKIVCLKALALRVG